MDDLTMEQRIARLTARQHGMVTRSQLLDLGLTPGSVDARVRSKRLLSVHRGVYLSGSLVGSLVPTRAREMAAVLACGPGAALSHQSAAVLLDLLPERGRPMPIHVTVRGRDRRPAGIRVHRVRSLPATDMRVVDGIQATALVRTLLDLAGTVPDRQLEKAVSHVERLGQSRDELASDLATRGPRRGLRRLLHLLEDSSAAAFTRSKAEDRLLALIRRATLPLPATNVRVGGYEVDCLWPDHGVAVEVDGFAHHRSRRSFEADRRRDLDLAGRGIQVVRITWRQLVDEPEAVLVRLTRTLVRAESKAAATVHRPRRP